MKFTFEERYKYYTNELFNNCKYYFVVIPHEWKTHRQDMPVYFNEMNDYKEIMNKYTGSYIIVRNDGYNNYNKPCFQKVRKINNHCIFSILHKLNFGRHWEPFYKNVDNVKWEEKKNEIIWRGCPTGNGERINFCIMYNNKYNVGLTQVFSHLTQYSYLIKNEIKVYDFYQYKYIISIEGNDKDSGLNWKLNSNSVVIMKPPTFESWLMEGKLEPWVHYVPLNDDMSNLDEIYEWCLNNDDKCKEIVKNANEFMENFKDLEFEKKLIDKIEKDYFKYIKIKFEDN